MLLRTVALRQDSEEAGCETGARRWDADDLLEVSGGQRGREAGMWTHGGIPQVPIGTKR